MSSGPTAPLARALAMALQSSLMVILEQLSLSTEGARRVFLRSLLSTVVACQLMVAHCSVVARKGV